MPTHGWWGGSTRKDNAIYLHILRWPEDTIQLPSIARRIVSHSVLTGGQAEVTQTPEGITVSMPAEQRDALDTIVKLELDGPAKDVPAVKSQPSGPPSLTTRKKATASNWFQKSDTYAPDKAVDGDLDTRWGCHYGTHSCWFEVDLGTPRTFSRAWISEPYDRVQQFELQVWEGDAWKTFHVGKTIGEDREISFPPLTGQRVRLNLVEASQFIIGLYGPTTRPGTYDVFISVGRRDGTPTIALPLEGDDGQRRYRVGTITIKKD